MTEVILEGKREYERQVLNNGNILHKI